MTDYKPDSAAIADAMITKSIARFDALYGHIERDDKNGELVSYDDYEILATKLAAAEARNAAPVVGALGAERKAFEAWATSIAPGHTLKRGVSEYESYPTQCAWRGWQARAQQAGAGQAVTVHQWHKTGCANWYDGFADHSDGRGPYESRLLYAAPLPPKSAAQAVFDWPPMPEPIEKRDYGQGLYSFDQLQTYARAAVDLADIGKSK